MGSSDSPIAIPFSENPFPDTGTGGVNSSNEGLPSSCATLKIRAAPYNPG